MKYSLALQPIDEYGRIGYDKDTDPPELANVDLEAEDVPTLVRLFEAFLETRKDGQAWDATLLIGDANTNGQLWVLRGEDIEGYHAYVDEQGALGPAGTARLFTDAEKAAEEARLRETGEDEEWEWDNPPTAYDIADMHYNTDPERVDEYVALMARADERRRKR